MFEAEGLESFEGLGAAGTGLTMNEVRFLFVEGVDLSLEVIFGEVVVDGVGEVAVFVFGIGANVEDGDFFLVDEGGGGFGVDVGDFGFGDGVGGEDREGEEEEKGGGEEGFHGTGGGK